MTWASRLFRSVAVALAVLSAPAAQAGWYNAAWGYRVPVAIDNTGNATAALSYFQVSASLTGAAYTAFAAHARADGSDLRLTDSDGVTAIPFALEQIDATSSTVYLLLKVPAVAAASTRTVYLYWGNPSATSQSSYTTTVGSGTALVGPTDIWNQAMSGSFGSRTYTNTTSAVRLRNQDKVNGGGAGLNGKVQAYVGICNNNAGDDCEIALATSSDGGATYGAFAVIFTPAAGNHATPRGFVVELADGTLLLPYGYSANGSGTALGNTYFARSTDGGTTWSNLSTTPANPLGNFLSLSVVGYGNVMQTAGGDLFFTIYGKNSGDTVFRPVLIKCASGSSPIVGSNWTRVSDIAFNGTNSWNETCACISPDGTHFIAAMRDEADASGDLWVTRSTDLTGTSWGTPAKAGICGPVNSSQKAVSPALLPLASGSVLLGFGVRFSSNYGAGAVISTDGGATWNDRPFYQFGAEGTGSDVTSWGYPSFEQMADGTIPALWYYQAAGGVNTHTNCASAVLTEDLLCNGNNVYDSCQSLTGWTAGNGVTVSATHTLGGAANGLKFDNSGASNFLANATRSFWPSLGAVAGPQKLAWSHWTYCTQNSDAGQIYNSGAQDSTPTTRVNVAVKNDAGQEVQWFNGSVYTVTSAPALAKPLNVWIKESTAVSTTGTTVSGRVSINNGTPYTSLGQAASGNAIQQIRYQAGTSGSGSHAITFWLGTAYSRQYTATTPAVTVGAEQAFTGAASLLPLGMAPPRPPATVRLRPAA